MDYLELPADLPVPADDGATAHLPGVRLPAVSLPSTAGDAVVLDALGAGRTVIYLYPLTGRPGAELPQGWDSIAGARGCTPESCGFRDHYRELRDAGVRRVFGLSSQDTADQQEAVERLHLPFAMLSDPTLKLADEIGLPTFEAGGRAYYKRLTLVIRDDRIEHVFYPVFPPDRHAEQVREWIEASR